MCCENTKVYCEKCTDSHSFTSDVPVPDDLLASSLIRSLSKYVLMLFQIVTISFSVYLPASCSPSLLKKYLASGPVMVIFQTMVPQGRVGVIKIDQRAFFVVAPFCLRSLDWWPQKLHLVKILPLRWCYIFSNSLDLSQHACFWYKCVGWSGFTVNNLRHFFCWHEKMLTLTDRSIYFFFRVVHSGTMLR